MDEAANLDSWLRALVNCTVWKHLGGTGVTGSVAIGRSIERGLGYVWPDLQFRIDDTRPVIDLSFASFTNTPPFYAMPAFVAAAFVWLGVPFGSMAQEAAKLAFCLHYQARCLCS